MRAKKTMEPAYLFQTACLECKLQIYLIPSGILENHAEELLEQAEPRKSP